MSDLLPKTKRLVNDAAIKRHALACSARFRAGKFTRVGEDFLEEIRVEADAWLRRLRANYETHMNDALETDATFITADYRKELAREVNRALGRVIQNRVQRQPSVGITLKATQ